MNLKNQHESAVLVKFGNYLNQNGHSFELLEQPDPPDAIVKIDGQITWIEITDAYLNHEFAESITTFAHPKKLHKPVPHNKRIIVEPDEQFSQIIVNIIQKKFTLPTLQVCYEKYGSGVLLVGMMTPFSDVYNLAINEREKIQKMVKNHMPLFNEIYFYSPWEQGYAPIIN